MIKLQVPEGANSVSSGPANYVPDAAGVVLVEPAHAIDLINLGCVPVNTEAAAKSDRGSK